MATKTATKYRQQRDEANRNAEAARANADRVARASEGVVVDAGPDDSVAWCDAQGGE